MLKLARLVEGRWFSLADLAAVAASCLLWVAFPALSWQPLLLAGLPWVLRLGAGAFPWRWTPFDWLLALFLLTALIGVWAAYDPEAAGRKFWILVGAVFLYYALAGQPAENFWPVAGLLSGAGAVMAVYFALTHDWLGEPANIDLINQIGLWLMAVRPQLPFASPHDNSFGGMLAMLLPLAAAGALRGWREERLWLLAAAPLSGGVIAAGLLLTSSRGAWAAAFAAFALWGLWGLSGRITQTTRQRQGVFLAVLAFGVFLSVSLAVTLWGGMANGLAGLWAWLPATATGESRYQLAYHTAHLAGDYWLIGGGLASFSGLYAHYIMDIPFFLFGYSHNFYLDLLLEQGLVGLAAMLLLLAGVAWRLLGRQNAPALSSQAALLPEAALVSLLIVALHGLVDSALYGQMGTPLLFVWAGLGAALTRPANGVALSDDAGRSWRRWLVATLLVILLLLAGYLFRRPLQAGWYANLGGVALARLELADFPAEEWRYGHLGAEARPAERMLQRAVEIEPEQAAAHYRLGLIARSRLDFETAGYHLEQAYAARAGHRGVQKALAYNYVWQERFEPAVPLLAGLPEAKREMEGYSWWWRTQGRDDLAQRAAQMYLYLDRIE